MTWTRYVRIRDAGNWLIADESVSSRPKIARTVLVIVPPGRFGRLPRETMLADLHFLTPEHALVVSEAAGKCQQVPCNGVRVIVATIEPPGRKRPDYEYLGAFQYYTNAVLREAALWFGAERDGRQSSV